MTPREAQIDNTYSDGNTPGWWPTYGRQRRACPVCVELADLEAEKLLYSHVWTRTGDWTKP